MAGFLWRGSLQTKPLKLLVFLKSTRTKTHQISRYVQPADYVSSITCRQCSQSRSLSSLTKNRAPLLSGSHQDMTQQRYCVEALPRKPLISRIAARFGFKGKLRYPARVLQRSGIRMYLCTAELIDYDEFFQEFQTHLPDTFNSWFRVLELHMWMCIVRLSSEGQEGIYVRNNMLKNMWEDVDKRSRKLGHLAASTERREGINQLSQEFRASLYSYDEGILSDDKVLAGTVWRNFFEMQCEDPESLEKMVHYVRKQMWHIDSQRSDMILQNGVITFLPFRGDKVNMERTKPILNEILDRT